MTRKLLTFAVLLLPIALACAEPGGHVPDHHAMQGASPSVAPVQVKINPEARISVMRAGALPTPVSCGTPVELAVNVVNQGFVTARLEAQLVGDPPAGVALDFYPEPLTGLPQEMRILRLVLTKASLADLTIAFRLLPNRIPDLGGLDRIHFLMRCVPRH